MHDYTTDTRFQGIEQIAPKKALLSSATSHREDELKYVEDCYDKGWITTVGENIDAVEDFISAYMSSRSDEKYAVALTNGTAAIHLAVKLAAERLYGSSTGITTPMGAGTAGALYGKRVFVSDMTFDASVNPVLYEGGEPIFIDSEYETWNMNPDALRRAFELYPDVKLVIFVHLYGVPGRIEECKKICEEHGALLIEDAAESLGAEVTLGSAGSNPMENVPSEDTILTVPTGSIGDYGIVSMNGNKIITGSSGGALVCPDKYSYEKAKKWSTQSREAAPWYEHEELGYNYRMSNIIAGVIRGQWQHLDEHISGKKQVFERYAEAFSDLPVKVHGGGNYWLSCLLIDNDAMEPFVMGDRRYIYEFEAGKSCPGEILDALYTFGAEGRPIWKPMHLQPMYRNNEFITVNGRTRGGSNAYRVSARDKEMCEVTTDIFNRGLCLPSDNKMPPDAQDTVIDIVKRCFE